ncbi:MAG: hypothetical protein RRY64_10555 [Oscillospiraceae bacterium]
MNDDLISRSALLEKLKPLEAVGGAELYRSACNEIIHKFFPKLICDQPTIDAVPVVHGRWLEDGDTQTCSNCGEEHEWGDYRASYCDACGAKMEEGSDHAD